MQQENNIMDSNFYVWWYNDDNLLKKRSLYVKMRYRK